MKTWIARAILCLALGWTSRSQAIPTYSIAPVGLGGVEHTRNDGYMLSDVLALGVPKPGLNQAGLIVGNSQRYNGGNIDLGRSTWVYNGTTTVKTGLAGPEHTRTDGYRFSQSYLINELGQTIGTSNRYNVGNKFLGESAWFFDGREDDRCGVQQLGVHA